MRPVLLPVRDKSRVVARRVEVPTPFGSMATTKIWPGNRVPMGATWDGSGDSAPPLVRRFGGGFPSTTTE